MRVCSVCGGELPPEATRRRVFCSSRCKAKGWRRQRAGLPEDFAANGFYRGSISLLAERRRRERQADYLNLVLTGPRP